MKKFVVFNLLLALFITLNCEIQDKEDANIAEMRQVIQQEGYTFTVGNTGGEHRCGLVEPKDWRKSARFMDPVLTAEKLALPASFDWRTQGGVTAIRNQGNCGSCWAFSAVGAFESAVKIKLSATEDFSEQYLVSCNTQGWGCDGGWWAHDMHKDGAVRETCFPYVASDVACKSTCTKYYKLDNWYYIGGSSSVPSVDAIKTAIYNYGPVSAAVYADSYFSNYTGGVFNRNASGNVNHAIVLVGWDDSKQAWILRNSWGTSWGESGYMYIKYGCQKVGYSANYLVVSGTTPPPSSNLALNKPVTVSGYYSSNLPKYAVDGNLSTYWAVSNSSSKTQWIYVNLQSVKKVNKVKIKWSLTNYATSYSIMIWNGSAWQIIKTIAGNGDWDEIDLGGSYSAQYIGVYCTQNNASYYTIYEYEVYGN